MNCKSMSVQSKIHHFVTTRISYKCILIFVQKGDIGKKNKRILKKFILLYDANVLLNSYWKKVKRNDQHLWSPIPFISNQAINGERMTLGVVSVQAYLCTK